MDIVIKEPGNRVIHFDNIEKITNKGDILIFTDIDGYVIMEELRPGVSVEIVR